MPFTTAVFLRKKINDDANGVSMEDEDCAKKTFAKNYTLKPTGSGNRQGGGAGSLEEKPSGGKKRPGKRVSISRRSKEKNTPFLG